MFVKVNVRILAYAGILTERKADVPDFGMVAVMAITITFLTSRPVKKLVSVLLDQENVICQSKI